MTEFRILHARADLTGLRSVDDLAWTFPLPSNQQSTSGGSECACKETPHLFFSTLDFAAIGFDLAPSVLPNAFYRFTPSTNTLAAVIPRGDILNPNGVALSKDFSYLYTTDYTLTELFGAGNQSSGSSAIYRYDLGPDCWPTNKRMITAVPSGGADGIKVDDAGRIWTAEGMGIVVRNEAGKVLGVFTNEYFLGTDAPPLKLAQLALAGDKLVILALDKIFVVPLSETVMSATRFDTRKQ